MVHVLSNCSHIVDVGQAKCAVDVDRVREMNKIEQEAANQGGLSFVNRALSAALTTGMVSVQAGIMEVDNFLCGEPEGLRKLSLDKVEGAVDTVCAAGLVEVLDELLEAGGVQQQQEEEERERGRRRGKMAAKVRRIVTSRYYPLWIAASNGRTGIVERLLRVEGVDVNRGRPDTGITPLIMACSQNHEAVVERLLAHDAIDVNQATTSDGVTPLFMACCNGHEAVVERLLEKGADMSIASPRFGTPLAQAQRNGHASIVAILRRAEKK